jgi:hypothetical protein
MQAFIFGPPPHDAHKKSPQEGTFFKGTKKLLVVDYRNEGSADFGASKFLDLFGGVLHETIAQGEESVVDTDPDALTGLHASTTLAHQDSARADKLAAEQLYAKALAR